MAAAQERLVEVEQAVVEPAGRRPVGADKTFRPYDPDQVLLMSPVLREWVPEGDLAHFVSDLVDQALDLSAIYASYEGERGFPPYDPRLMLKLILYGYATGCCRRASLSRRPFATLRCGCYVPASTLTFARSAAFASVICTRSVTCSCRRCGCARRPGWCGWPAWRWTARSCAPTRRVTRR